MSLCRIRSHMKPPKTAKFTQSKKYSRETFRILTEEERISSRVSQIFTPGDFYWDIIEQNRENENLLIFDDNFKIL